jgi:uncharacterized protein (TIGR03435 family)
MGASMETSRLGQRRRVMGRWLLIATCLIVWTARDTTSACTAFCAVGAGQVLVGNNEDWTNPDTKLWFVPAAEGTYGRMYVGFDDLWPQGGMNERGLWFDGFAAPPVRVVAFADRPSYDGNIIDKAMSECATVEEVVQLFSRYNRNFLREGILMFADASGDAVSIEPNAFVRKSGRSFVQTNFHQSRSKATNDRRFSTASSMLQQAGDDISVDVFRRILAATHQEGNASTLYSNIYDLRARTMHLYYFHDFERVVTFDLAEELKKGNRVLDIPSLFPPNPRAEAFAAQRRQAVTPLPEEAIVGGLVVFLVIVLAIVTLVSYKGGRRVRIGVALAFGAVVAGVGLVLTALSLHPRSSAPWLDFSIGPATGNSSSISQTAIRSSGITAKGLVAVAYDIPAVRVFGPPWLSTTRYAVDAVVDLDDASEFRAMLRQELEQRLHLEAHKEKRPFDVFVLSQAGELSLERTDASNPNTWIGTNQMRLQNGSMERVTAALQSILGRPVVDETGIDGAFNLTMAWEEDRVESITRTLAGLGLRLTPERRDLEALVVDRARRDPALLLMEQVGSLAQAAPASLRQPLGRIFNVR